MHILLVSKDGDGAWFVWLLIHEGHKVEWTCANPKYQDSLRGLVPPPLTKVSDPAAYDLIIYDDSGFGDSADAARAHSPVIGGSAYADRLEDDRVFGIEQMEAAGIKVPKWEAFSSPAEALSFLAKNNRRYVLKPIGDAPSDATYVSKSRDDMTHFIETKLDAKVKSFVLQEFVAGTEVSTEAWWTGREFVAMNHTLELKKFMNDDMGPNTGCAGNVVWMPTRPNAIYEQGLKKLASELGGFPPQMFDLNTIVTEADIYGLEWTPRFGYEGTCNLTRLLNGGFGEFLFAVATGTSPVVEPRARFAATIRLSVPPYPNAELARKRVQVPIVGVEVERLDSFVLYDVMKDEDEVIITGGYNNGIGGPIGCGETIDGAFQECDEAIHRLDIPNLQYRTDASKSLQARYSTLQAQGWLRPIG